MKIYTMTYNGNDNTASLYRLDNNGIWKTELSLTHFRYLLRYFRDGIKVSSPDGYSLTINK